MGITQRKSMAEHSTVEISHVIKRILATDLEVSQAMLATCELDTPLLGRGIGLDSVEAMALVLSLERDFDIQVPDTDLTVELFQSLRALSDYVYQKLDKPDA